VVFVDQRTVNDLADELAQALRQLEVPAEVDPVGVRPDGLGELHVEIDGRPLTIAVTTRADLRPASARDLPVFVPGRRLSAVRDRDGDVERVVRIDRGSRAERRARPNRHLEAEAELGLVFADRLSERSREVLRDHGWGWLDRRRGQLRIWCPGVRIDAAVEPSALDEERPRVRDPFTPAGRQVALWLLLHPDQPASPRGIARELDVSAGQVSNLLAALSADALLRRDRTPLVPELFWALAEHWKPKRHALAALPTTAELAGAGELQAGRWVMGDTRAAAAYGAPLAVAPDYPPDLYVPDQKTLSWVLSRSVLAPDYHRRAATVAVVPAPIVADSRLRVDDPGEPWPLAHPVIVALDLAVDRSRGREVLEAWDPPAELDVTRVW
jgi:hypothetical protein